MKFKKWILGGAVILVAVVAFVLTTISMLTNPGKSYIALFILLVVCHGFTWCIHNMDKTNDEVIPDCVLSMAASWLLSLSLVLCIFFTLGKRIEATCGEKGITLFFLAMIMVSFCIGYYVSRRMCRIVYNQRVEWVVYSKEMNCVAAAFTVLAFILIFVPKGSVFAQDYESISNYLGGSVCFADVLLTFLAPIGGLLLSKFVSGRESTGSGK